MARVRDAFLMHAIVNIVKEKTLPTNHLDLKEFEEYVRRYVEERAKREGERITKERLDELTKYLLEYHKEMLEGLSPKGKP